jgi:hypothetical protein
MAPGALRFVSLDHPPMRSSFPPALLLALAAGAAPMLGFDRPASPSATSNGSPPIAAEPPRPEPTGAASAQAAPDAVASAASAPLPQPPARFPVRWTQALKLTGLDALPAALAEELKPNNAPLDLHVATGPITTCAGYFAALDGGAEHAASTFEEDSARFKRSSVASCARTGWAALGKTSPSKGRGGRAGCLGLRGTRGSDIGDPSGAGRLRQRASGWETEVWQRSDVEGFTFRDGPGHARRHARS